MESLRYQYAAEGAAGRPDHLEEAQMQALGAFYEPDIESTAGMETHEQQAQLAPSAHRYKDPMVREPNAAELREFTCLQDIVNWAKLKGDVTWSVSKPGAFLRLLVHADDMEDYDISEFASIPMKQIESILPKILASWKPKVCGRLARR